MRTHAAVTLLLLAGCVARASAQGPARVPVAADTAALPAVYAAPDALPGSVVSVAVRVPADHDADSARFAIHPGTRVLLYGSTAGTLTWTGAEAILPLTFSVPRDEAAGVMHVAQVEVEWPDGNRWIVDVQTRVAVRRALELRMDTTSAHVPRGEPATLGFTVRNTGNAADTVGLAFHAPAHWQITPPPALAIAPGAEVHGTFTVHVAGDAFVGETQIIGVSARGLGSESAASVSLQVASDTDVRGSRVSMPATVVVGFTDAGALDASPFAIGLDAAGPVAPGVDASLLVRYEHAAYTAPALQRYLSGPSLRAEVRTDEHRLTVGDILFGGSALFGAYTQASGVDGEFRLGDTHTTLVAARPHQLDSPERAGHLLTTRTELPAFGGTLGIAVADLNRPYGVGDLTETSQLAMASFATQLIDGLSARAEAGFMQLRDADGRTRAGAAIDVHSRYQGGGLALEARMRRVPGALATSGSAVDETFVSGAFALGGGMSVNAWALRNDVALLDGTSSRQEGAALALRWHHGLASAQLSAHTHETDGSSLFTGDSRRRALSFGGTAPLGPLMLDGTLEIGGAETRGVEESLRQASARLSYQRANAWAWVGATHASGLFGSDLTRVDAGATGRAGRFEVDARAGTYVGRGNAAGRLDAWASTTFHVDSRTSLIAGLDYSPWNPGNGVRVSLGARRSFGLPLPLRRRATAEGTIYDDRNGNLQRDPGEPPLAGVRIRRGGRVAISDERGRFVFYDDHPAHDDLRVDVASLGAGLMVPPGVPLPPVGRVAVPVHRAASLRLELFNDPDDDGVRTADENAARGASIELVDERGRTRTASADANGIIEFSALSPGSYRVTAYAVRGQPARSARMLEVRIEAGAAAQLDVPVPFRPLEIRFRTPLPPDTVTTIIGASRPDDGHRPALPALAAASRPAARAAVEAPARDATIEPAAASNSGVAGDVVRSAAPLPARLVSSDAPRPVQAPAPTRALRSLPGTHAILAWVILGLLLLWYRRRRQR